MVIDITDMKETPGLNKIDHMTIHTFGIANTSSQAWQILRTKSNLDIFSAMTRRQLCGPRPLLVLRLKTKTRKFRQFMKTSEKKNRNTRPLLMSRLNR